LRSTFSAALIRNWLTLKGFNALNDGLIFAAKGDAGDQLQVRYLQKIHELCAASIRALSGDASLLFRGPRLHNNVGPLPLFAPHLHPSIERDDFVAFRGAADAYALRLRQSNQALHQSLMPIDSIERLVFDLLEQFRVEALVPPEYLGMRGNLRYCFERWSLAFDGAGFTQTISGLLLFSVAHMCRSRVTGDPVDDDTADRIETTRGKVNQLVGNALQGLRRERTDQSAYAQHALLIAQAVAQLLVAAEASGAEKSQQGDSIELAAFALLDVEKGDDAVAVAGVGTSKVLANAADGYRIFTTQYDKQWLAVELVRAEQLAEFRKQLDKGVAGLGVNVQRMARQLRALLAIPQRNGWNNGEDDGYIDGRRLSQLVASPNEKRIFRQERVEAQTDCAITFLIDCSGSMKTHIQSLAALLDIFVRALDMADLQSEVLGFTTGAWTGGRAQKAWQKAGKPTHPGRLNEAAHIVFKGAETSWRRARPSLAALLKSEIFREGIDGEAVLWAKQRLASSDADRKILVVVSDGSPMDSATNLANDEHYLDHHLRDVVQAIELRSDISIVGIGVGLDMSPYYRKSHVLDLINSPANQSLREMIELIAAR
jgi:cobaltochelatase CobT